MGTTVLSDFHRTIRNEPKFYIYKHQVWLTQDEVPVGDVKKWLQERYLRTKTGHRYRVVTYSTQTGEEFVDHVLLETLTDGDLLFMKMRWGFSKEPVVRTKRSKRRRLTKEQIKRRDAILAEFYASL